MKSILRSAAVLVACLLAATGRGKGLDISDTITLDRYTLIDGDTFKHDTGYLLKSGQFHVVISDTEYYNFYGLTPDDIAPFSGKPLMDETLYDQYHSLGLIPHWIASPEDFTIGYETFVIVAVAGKGDPYPTVTITTQPKSDQIIIGGPAFFYVDAEPFEYLSYQWYLNKKPIPGATSSGLWINNVTKAQAGVYKVAPSTGGKPVMSQGALLQIVTPVAIKKQPTPLTVKTGKKATFKVIVTGTSPFHFQWYVGTTAIPNATNSSYTIAQVQSSDAGQYGVGVNNSLTFVGSGYVTLTVTP